MSSQAIASLNGGLFFGSLVGVLLLLAVPLTLLGMVSPFAIRLVTSDVQQAGKRAGQVFAVSTVGSILGAFTPVLLLIPAVGTRSTFLIFAVLLLGLALIATTRLRRRLLYTALLAILIVLWVAVKPGPVRPADGLVLEGESALQFFQVIDSPAVGRRSGPERGHRHPLDLSPRPPAHQRSLGLLPARPHHRRSTAAGCRFTPDHWVGGGTVSKQYTTVYGDHVAIDGVEIDDRVIELGRKYFDMNEPNLKTYAEDGRTFLQRVDRRYDVIAVDAYRQPYIPFHLVTQEFFIAARDHLNEKGVLALNAGRTATDFRLVEVLSETMRSVFPHVYVIDLPSGFNNSLVFGSLRPVTDAEVRAGAAGDPRLAEIADRPWELREVNRADTVYTDDLAPVERLIDDIVVREALHGATGRRR